MLAKAPRMCFDPPDAAKGKHRMWLRFAAPTKHPGELLHAETTACRNAAMCPFYPRVSTCNMCR